MKEQIYQIKITPHADVPLEGEGSIEWQLLDLLDDCDHPNNVMEFISGDIEEIKLIKKEEN